jgi:hypothetical protein
VWPQHPAGPSAHVRLARSGVQARHLVRQPMADPKQAPANGGELAKHFHVPGMFNKEWAEAYDAHVAMAIPGHGGILSLCNAHLSRLPDDARILCVGVGTGQELLHLAERHPGAPCASCAQAQPTDLLASRTAVTL